MNVVQYFRVLRRRWKLVAALAALGAVAAFMLAPRPRSLSTIDGPSSYIATHTLFVNPVAKAGGGPAAPVSLAQTPLLVTGGDVTDRVAAATGIDPNELLANVVTRADASLDTVDITYHDPDGDKAAQVADEFAVQLANTLNDLESQRTQQQVAVLQEQRNQIKFLYDTLEGDRADPLVQNQASALLDRLTEVEDKLQDANQVPGSDPYLLTLRSSTPVPVTDAEFDALVEASNDPSSQRSAGLTALQAQSNLISERGQAGVNPLLAATGGALLGALIGVGIALAINRLDPRLFTKEDLEEAAGFPVIAEVPSLARSQRQASAVVSRDSPYSRYAESFRALRSSILFVQHTGHSPGVGPMKVDGDRTTAPNSDPDPGDPGDDVEKLGTTIMVTSPGPGEGKTTTVANLAAVMAEDGSRVLVVNCDFRRPRLHLYLDAPNETRKVSNTNIPGVKLVADVVSDHQRSSPAEVLAAQRHLVTTARTMFDYILLDTAPVLTTTDASEVLSVTDMVVMICRAGKTTAEAADRAAELLERFQAPVIGGVLVGADDAPSSRYYYYYSDDTVPSGPVPSLDADPFATMRQAPADESGPTDQTDAPSEPGSTGSTDGGQVASDGGRVASDEQRDDVGDVADAPTS